MEFRVVTDRKEWNSFALKFPDSSFISSWDWGVFEREIGSKFENSGLYNSDDLVALLPIKTVNAIRGKYTLLRHAPVVDWSNVAVVQLIVNFLRDYCKEKKCHFIRVSLPNQYDQRLVDKLHRIGFKKTLTHGVDGALALALDITKSEEELLNEMRKSTRQSIKKSLEIDLECYSTTSIDEFDEFWEIFEDSAQRNHWRSAYSRKYVETEYRIFSEAGLSRLFFTKYKGEYTAAGMFTYFNGQSVYHHSGSLTKFRELPSMYLMQWEAIKYAKSIGMKVHNLWGVVDKDDTKSSWYGLSLFKRGFGGYEVRLVPTMDLILNPFAYATRTYEWVEAKRKGI